MTHPKIAFVGAKKGELSVMISQIEITMGVDLAMPNLAPFMIKAPLVGHGAPDLEVLFADMVNSLASLVLTYLGAQGIDPKILEKLGIEIQKAVQALDNRYSDERFSDNGSGVLETVRDLEQETLFEAEFDLPEGFLAEAHTRVVTATGDITQTPAFKSWFAGSKIVDKNGQPLRCVHGTPHEFDRFKDFGSGIWFSSIDNHLGADLAILDEGNMSKLPTIDPDDSDDLDREESNYPVGARMIPVYLSVKNPKVMDGGYPDLKALKRAGHDGVIYLENGEIEAVVVFDPTQAKSAIVSGFNPNDQRITANVPIIRRTPLFQPTQVKTGPQTSIIQRPTPSLKNIIQKYRTQQGKPLSGPLFVLVYDSCGRPVGVRSIKGPGWSGNGGGGKIAAEADPEWLTDPLYFNPVKNEIIETLKALPYANNIRVFGSAARGKEAPGDIDAILYVPKMTWAQFVERPASTELLALARKHYGSFDPFVQLADCFICRDAEARSWENVKNPKKMLAEARRDGKRLEDIPVFKVTPKTASPAPLESPQFKQWFAGSAIVDAQGKPLRLYHGTGFGPGAEEGFRLGQGGYIYCTPDPSYANEYSSLYETGAKSYLLFANAKNPLDLRHFGVKDMRQDVFFPWCHAHGIDFPASGHDTGGNTHYQIFDWVKYPGFKGLCQAKGYDSIWIKESIGGHAAPALLLFDPHQLKSAIGNNGNYDLEDARLTASKNSGGGKVASPGHTNRRCPICGGYTRCKCMMSDHRAAYPPDGVVPETEGLCYSCAEKAKIASKDTISLKNWRTNTEEVDVYVNPSRTEFKATCMKDSGIARAFVFPKQNKVVGWAGYAAIHDDIAKDYLPLLGLPVKEGIAIEAHYDSDITVSDYSRNSIYFHDPKTAEALESCPALLQAMGGYISFVTYFDEERVGDWSELEAPGATVEPINASQKTSSAKSFQRLVVARDAGAIVGTLVFADYPHDRRILSVQVGVPGIGLLARMVAALGDDKPIFAMAQTNQNLDELLDGIATKTSKTFANEGMEELGFKPVGNQLVKQAGTAKDIIELQPDTVLSVFHGCQPDDASQFCAEGIDALSHHGYRRYPHTDMGQPVLNGLFVAPDFQTATMFGRTVIKFKTEAKNLHYIYPSQEAEADDMYRERYPKSFRPSLTQTLIGNLNLTYDPRTGGYAGYEHQALFLGTVSPRAIERVYYKDPDTGKMTSMDTTAYLKANPPGPYTAKPGEAIEPQETFKDFDSFLRRFCEVSHYDLPEMEKTMEWAAPAIMENQNPLQTFADYFGTVPKIVITRVLPLLMAKYS